RLTASTPTTASRIAPPRAKSWMRCGPTCPPGGLEDLRHLPLPALGGGKTKGLPDPPEGPGSRRTGFKAYVGSSASRPGWVAGRAPRPASPFDRLALLNIIVRLQKIGAAVRFVKAFFSRDPFCH